MKIPRKMAIALLAGVSIAGIAGASAASLGATTSAKLGSADVVVASCDTDGVNLAYTTTYNAVAGTYQVTAVTISGINVACAGQNLSFALRDSTGAQLATGSSSNIPAATTSLTVNLASAVSAAAVSGASVLIAG